MSRATRRANLVVERPEGQRWEAGLEMLSEGASLLINDILLYLDPDKNLQPSPRATLVVEADASSWWHQTPDDERPARARGQLIRTRDNFQSLVEEDQQLEISSSIARSDMSSLMTTVTEQSF